MRMVKFPSVFIKDLKKTIDGYEYKTEALPIIVDADSLSSICSYLYVHGVDVPLYMIYFDRIPAVTDKTIEELQYLLGFEIEDLTEKTTPILD